MEYYTWTTVLLGLMMIAMILHVLNYSGFTRQQKIWFVLTFASVVICAGAEYAVHCGVYDKAFALPLTVITAVQFSLSPMLAVFFSGALGLHKEAKKAARFFLIGALAQTVCAPFGLIFYFSDEGYFRGDYFIIYEIFYFLALIYLAVCMIVVGRRFRRRDIRTIVMILLLLATGILPMMVFRTHVAYVSIGICACLCYIYYNDLVQQDIQAELVAGQKRISDMQAHTISGLANLIESRDANTGEHVSRTSRYVKAIAEAARREGIYGNQIDDRFISLMYTLAPLHDVGKILVPDSILQKPGKLTPEEFEVIKTHAVKGGAVVRRILDGVTDEENIRFVSDIAVYHHERWDGAGYPEGLREEEIPLAARIMAIADVFDALVSERCYKEAYAREQALEIIRSESGTHFDPRLVEVFLKYESEFTL